MIGLWLDTAQERAVKGQLMRRIVVSEFLSLDGVMEDPGGAEGFAHGGWTFRFSDPEGMQYKLSEVMEHEALLLGRVTYTGFAAAWPGQSDEVGFADKMNAMPKYVISRTLKDARLRTTPRCSVAMSPRRSRRSGAVTAATSWRPEAPAWSASSPRTTWWDEYRLMVFPIVLGSGRLLFGDLGAPAILKLVEVSQLGSGTVILTYHRGDRTAEPSGTPGETL